MARKIQSIFIGAELRPIVKVGGLGDVMASLPQALQSIGADIKIIIPFYGNIDTKKYKAKLVKSNVKFALDGKPQSFSLYVTYLPGTKIEVYMIKAKPFNYKKVYVGKRKVIKGTKYTRGIRDVERFIFFCKAAVETIRVMKWKPDIIHAHDWHAALVPTYIDEYALTLSDFPNIKTLFTIHNLANQGISHLDIVDYASLHVNLTPAVMEDYYDKDGDKIDLMKIGILSADYVNTVSPNYAKEILTKEYGETLEKYLQRRKKNLWGILNGIDVKAFDPKTDKSIKKKYSIADYKKGKKINKDYLQKISGLPERDVPVYGMVSRLVKQKGLDIMIPALESFLAKHDAQVVILGTGYEKYEKQLKDLEKKHPKKMKANILFDAKLAQQIYAGSDFFLMPSKFEPCGLGQMISMRYGTLPIARKTGGLKDTVNSKNGIVFTKYNKTEMLKAFKKAESIYKNKKKLDKMIKQDMKEDFSWTKSAKQYKKLYERLS